MSKSLNEGKNNKNNKNNNNSISYVEQNEKEKYSIKNNLDNKEIKKEITKFQNEKEKSRNINNERILKNLKEKENTIIKEINTLKSIKNEMGTLSYNNISQAKIDNTLHDKKIKKLQNLENNLIDKLIEIKRQINDITQNNNFAPNRNQKGFMRNKNTNTNNNNKYIYSIDKVQLLEQNEMRLMEIEKEYKNKQKELKEFEENSKNKKWKYLLEQRQKEMEIIKKRKKDIDEKMRNIKDKTKSAPNEEECLFYKMEKNFKEKEKKLLHKITTERKVNNIYHSPNVDVENIKNEFQDFKNQLQQRSIEQTNNMKKMWHSRSMIMKQYKTNMMKTIKEKDENVANNEKIMKLTKKGLFLEKEIYGKKKVHLPPIDEKLKQESIKNQIDIKTLTGKERIKYVNERYMQKSLKIRNTNKELDYGKKIVFKTVKKKKIPGSMTPNEIQPKQLGNSFSSENIMNKNNLNKRFIYNMHNKKNVSDKNINNNNIKLNNISSSADKIRIKKIPKDINYLEQFKNKNKDKEKYHKWNKYIVNKGEEKIDMEGVQNINKQIEILDEKVNMGNELLKIRGGYENNIDFGNQVSTMLIDSINGKLEVIKELYNEKNNTKK